MHPQNTRAKLVAVMLDGSRRIRDRKKIMKNAVSKIASVTLVTVVMPCAALRCVEHRGPCTF